MKPIDVDALAEGVRASDRAALGRAITLVESDAPAHLDLAQALLAALLPHTGAARRVGISGVPGVGKSTFIDALGMHLLDAGHRVAVLAVDPTSGRSGGSILGDKTRMARLSRSEASFIRPSPSRGALGGVARKTRESALVCEAGGFDVVLVETVGVGQSEIEVAQMVDTFLVLMLPNAGDELQGIKRGIVEVADLIAINKADGAAKAAADQAKRHYDQALRFLRPTHPEWAPEVLTVSAKTGDGIGPLWARVEAHRAALEATGSLERVRADQAVRWMWRAVEDGLRARLRDDPDIARLADALEADVRARRVPPTRAASQILARLSDR